jgi:glutamate formiminotransferase
MSLIAIPNVSEGADGQRVADLRWAVSSGGATVLDTHSDPVHNRSVFTATGEAETLVESLTALAVAAVGSIDLAVQEGVHPRVGCLDVCPLVPHDAPMSEAVGIARAVARSIAADASVPVFLYGDAQPRTELRELPSIRRGGLSALTKRIHDGLTPDFGPAEVDQHKGVVCVGAREVLIAFNVWIDADVSIAHKIARSIRSSDGGLPGVRALGMAIDKDRSQVSMNLTDPARCGIDDAFGGVAEAAAKESVSVASTELIGLIPERYMPDPDATAARLLIRPGRCLERVLELPTAG